MEFTDIQKDPTRTLVRLPDQSVQITRIFPWPRLLEIVRTRKMALVSPTMWDDPREDLARLAMLDGFHVPERRGHQQSLAEYLAPAWGQCWSLNPGSDALLRAYSRVSKNSLNLNEAKDLEGVTVRSTVGSLISASDHWHSKGADCHVLLGRVEYMSDRDIMQGIVNACNSRGPEFFRTVQGRAYQLLQKREYFRHEEEVRLLMISRNPQASEKLRLFDIEPEKIFHEISFDPRLTEYERREREKELRDAGFTGSVVRDESYQGIALQVVMTRDWIDP